MAQVPSVQGVQQAIQQLQKYQRAKASGCARGLKLAGLFLLRESLKLVPVDTGNLRASGFTRADGSGFGTVVTVGYTAAYAVFVHEDLEAAHGEEFNRKYAKQLAAYGKGKAKSKSGYSPYSHARGPQQQAKFLSTPIEQHGDTIRDMIRQETLAA